MNEKILFIKKIFGNGHIDGRKKNISVKCPNPNCKSHSKNKLKFCILLENFACHCWVCDIKNKNLYGVIRKYKSEFLSEYLNKFSEFSKFATHKDEENEKEKIFELPQGFVLLAINLLSNLPEIKKAINYLYGRGLNENDFWKYKIGYCNKSNDKHSDRIIFPSFDKDGNLNYFISRGIGKTLPPYFTCDKSHKEIIFNEYLINFSKEVILVEGIFDAIKAGDNSIPLLGSVLSKQSFLFKTLVQNNTNILLSLDKDAETKMNKIANLLHRYGLFVKTVIVEENKDIGELPHGAFNDYKTRAIEWKPDTILNKKVSNI